VGHGHEDGEAPARSRTEDVLSPQKRKVFRREATAAAH